MLRIFCLKNRGSRKVTKTGKVEKPITPMATVDIWIEWKNNSQCSIKTMPESNIIAIDFLDEDASPTLKIFRPSRMTIAANRVRPKTIIAGLAGMNLPKSPVIPNKTTAI